MNGFINSSATAIYKSPKSKRSPSRWPLERAPCCFRFLSECWIDILRTSRLPSPATGLAGRAVHHERRARARLIESLSPGVPSSCLSFRRCALCCSPSNLRASLGCTTPVVQRSPTRAFSSVAFRVQTSTNIVRFVQDAWSDIRTYSKVSAPESYDVYRGRQDQKRITSL
jgi:hypothetical protein